MRQLVDSGASASSSPGVAASSAVTSSVSDVECIRRAQRERRRTATRQSRDPVASSWVLIRLPLWPSARSPVAVARKVGWAFSQTLEPVVE